MFGGVGKAGWATILASGVLLSGGVSAQAADLGGDCCADLEERIAELEATTARKGNRKVSLSLYGWVNEAVMWWDDGTESNVYVGTNTLEQSRFGFKGKAKINGEWEAGYKIEIGVASGGFDKADAASDDNDGSSGFKLRKSYWYLKSKKLGAIEVGQNGTATYHAIDDANFTNTRNVSDYQAPSAYLGAFKTNHTGPKWSDILRGWDGSAPGQSSRKKVVKYVSPTFAGFTVSAAWGEDDMWDALASYEGVIGEFKVKVQGGYGEATDQPSTKCDGTKTDYECHWFGAGATIMHEPTGLYVFGGYGWQKVESQVAGPDDTSEAWYIQPGIEKKWNPLGKTTIFGEYRHDEAGSSAAATDGADVDFWSAGAVQKIDAAAMDLYVMYRHADGEYTNGAVTTDAGDFDQVIAGSRIQF
jgi:predicted porin